VNCEPKTFKR